MTIGSDDCGCCANPAAETPAEKYNAPGLPALTYRVGDWAEFKARLQARLSSTDYPALAALSTRSADDWTLALTDAFACCADVLTFYQERLVNESYLRTSTERRSVLELARLIGYKLAPGVAASTAFAFTLENSPGAIAQAAQPVTIPVSTLVQSIPDSNQKPQNFETIDAITARVEWNAMAVLTRETIRIEQNLCEIYITGVANNLQPGDAILIVGLERSATDAYGVTLSPNNNRWDVRWIDTVTPDPLLNLTHLRWSKPLGSAWKYSPPTAQAAQIFVFRQRAALFGNNAPMSALLPNVATNGLLNAAQSDWANKSIDTTSPSPQIDLDAAYPKVVRHSWVALAGGSGGIAPVGYVELYRVTDVTQTSLARYALSSKITRLTVDSTANLDATTFGLRQTLVLAQSEELSFAARPLRYPLYGDRLVLGSRQSLLAPGQRLAVSGKMQRVSIPADTSSIVLIDDSVHVIKAGDSYQLLAAPELQVGSQWQARSAQELDPALYLRPDYKKTWSWSLQHADGNRVIIHAPAGALLLQAALATDDVVSEVVACAAGADGVDNSDPDVTALNLVDGLQYCYDRSTVSINANVAGATHGESVSEIGGSGSAVQANQAFLLKQTPLTYISSDIDASGAAATLQVRVNDLLWREQATLYGSGPQDRVYTLSQADDGSTTVAFGNGVAGGRLPTGQNNLRFAYRKGIGAAGNLRSGQLSSLLTRPLGVKAVINPIAATGGADPESFSDARQNAPLRVLTLDRAVSVQDYSDFARAFAGIAKADGLWINNGRARGLYLTVAGGDGAAVPEGGATQQKLIAALRQFGDPLLPLRVQSYIDCRFTLQAKVKLNSDADPVVTLPAVEAALRKAYAFATRSFAQPVTLDEVYAVIQSVKGVLAADITQLYRSDQAATMQPWLPVRPAMIQADGSVSAAELLTLDKAPLTLGVMS